MSKFILLQSEKAYNLQSKNTYSLLLVDKNTKITRTLVELKLRKLEIIAERVNILTCPVKLKRRGKKFNLVKKQKGVKKVYITLKEGVKFDEEKLTNFNSQFDTVMPNTK
jgi:ribosomal protein L23